MLTKLSSRIIEQTTDSRWSSRDLKVEISIWNIYSLAAGREYWFEKKKFLMLLFMLQKSQNFIYIFSSLLRIIQENEFFIRYNVLNIANIDLFTN